MGVDTHASAADSGPAVGRSATGPLFHWTAAACAVITLAVGVMAVVLPDRPALIAVRVGASAAFLTSAVVCFWTAARAGGGDRLWRLLVGVMVLAVAVASIVVLDDAVRKGTVLPEPTAYSLFYLVPLLFGLVGLLSYPAGSFTASRGQDRLWPLVAGLDAVILVGALALLAWIAVLENALESGDGIKESAVYVFTFAFASVLLMVAVILVGAFRRPRSPLGLGLLGSGLLVFSLSFMSYFYALVRGHEDVPRVVDLGFFLAPMLAAFATLVSGGAGGDDGRVDGRVEGVDEDVDEDVVEGPAGDAVAARRRWWHLALPYVPLVVAGVASLLYLAGQKWTGEAVEEMLVLLSLALLALVRQLVTMADNARLLARLEENRRALRRQVFHDPLTGLPNRLLFADRLAHALRRRERRPGRMAVLFCDLNDFKHVNDGLGHAAGDELLRVVAGRLRASVRAGDTVARFGGDEFAVLLEPGIEDPRAVAARLAGAVREPLELAGTAFAVGVSVGVVVVEPSDGGVSAEELLHRADLAMYAAKAGDGGDVTVYRPELSAPMTEAALHARLAAALRGAPGGGVLAVDYRPIVELAGGAWVAYEADLIWSHPELGMVRPVALLPSVEKTGVGPGLDRLLLRQACGDAARMGTLGGRRLPVHITVTADRLAKEGFTEEVIAALERAGLAGEALVVRISATNRTSDLRAAVREACRLREVGVRLALADVGAPGTAVDTLLTLPVDYIRLTPSLTRLWLGLCERGGRMVTLLGTCLSVVINAGITAIADGVDDPDSARRLRERGCRLATGDLFAGPFQFVPAGAGRTVTASGRTPPGTLPESVGAR